ncbi:MULTISPECIES: division/cell wall cluster transcriptional repressor MraZ [Prevotella]|uniref:Transcriptional regulator MraZ n=1 Tax=Prevotella herbatica TaxID=2801997 RepID=A0ABM7NYA0_9BACT|nr:MULTISPECIES: division/cell wall cluster transcriptional repressor MraZ [Prevotella]MDN5552687.1 division/cell wall cluster transcriptional repressor MraZ [Prevotella sp.]BCS85492.1 transcriptional regulator MraZ [Prevotella herbatica]
MRFLGNIEAKTDAKGRAFLPVIFRKVLQASGEEKLILRKDVFEKCLVLYPESVWNEQLNSLRNRLNRWDRQEWQVFRQFVSDAEFIALDSNGRFLIPKRYLKMVNIEQDIMFKGVDDTIEIWSKSNCDNPDFQPEEFSKTLQGIMSNKEV